LSPERPALFTRGRFAVVGTLPADVPAIATGLRPGDLAEIRAEGFAGAREAIEASVAVSSLRCLAMMEEGRPIAICGVAGTILSRVGRPWMLGTLALDRPGAQRALLAFSRLVAGLMRDRYDHLENYVDARYAEAVRWVEWMGFTIEPPVPFGINGELFHRFWWKRGP